LAFDRGQQSHSGEMRVDKNLSLSVAKGEFLTMLGPSAFRNTMWLMMRARFEAIGHGKILLDAHSIASEQCVGSAKRNCR
jgi:putative spermidine/putrescine transport system ATP-binding protein